MDVKSIVQSYLKENGFDGLVQRGMCGCAIDDLAPCDHLYGNCETGYKGPCICGEGCDFDIYPALTGYGPARCFSGNSLL